MSTEYVDSLGAVDETFLKAELSRLRTTEEERGRLQRSSKHALDEENRRLAMLIRERIDDIEQAEKNITGFQSKLGQSQSIVLDLERTLRKLQKDAEQSRKCGALLEAYNAFASSPTKLHEILGENDDGVLSASLQILAESIKDPDQQLTCNNLRTWIQARVDDRLAKFDVARRRNHVEEMSMHASYVCQHRRGGDVLCGFVAKLAVRPFQSAAKTPPVKDDVALLFEQIVSSLQEGRRTINIALGESPGAMTKYADKVVHFLLSDDSGLKTLLHVWFPSLGSPPPGVSLDRVEMLALTRTQLDHLFETFRNETDVNDLKARISRAFEPIAKDYYMLEISLLEFKFKSECPKLPSPQSHSTLIELERLMFGECKSFLETFLAHAERAYARASAFLQEDALEVCLETLVSSTSARVVDQVILPCCHLSSRVFQNGVNEEEGERQAVLSSRAGPDSAPIQLLKRSMSARMLTLNKDATDDEDGSDLSLTDKCRFVNDVLVPFVETSLDSLEASHSFCEPGSAAHSLVQVKVVNAEKAVEQIVSSLLDGAYAVVAKTLSKSIKIDLEKSEEDAALMTTLKSLEEVAKDVALMGEGALSNLALAVREIIFMRIGAMAKISVTSGHTLARELNRFAAHFDVIFASVDSPENSVMVKMVSSEIRQLAHMFVLPREDVLRGSLVLDKISKDVAVECMARRTY